MADVPLFVDVGGVTLHAVLSGAAGGLPVVFINSLGCDLRLWGEVAAALDNRYRVLRYDTRGHGLSDAPEGEYRLHDLSGDLLGLLDALRLERVVLVGVSVGGLTALDFARRYPERVLGAVLCDTGLKIGTPESWANRMAAIQAGGLEALADSVVERWFTPGFLMARTALVRGYRNMLTRTTPAGYLGTCAALRDADLSGGDPLGVPTLVLCGDSDVSTPPELSGSLAAELQAPLHLIGNAGHLSCAEQPGAVTHELEAFLEEVELAGSGLSTFVQGAQPAASLPAPVSGQTRYERGMRVRRAVLGDAHVDRALLGASDLDRDFQEFITEYAWGGPWSRGHLDTRTRHLVTLAVLAALPREHELAMHLRATVNTGVTQADLRELFMHVAVYAGVPVANRAYALAREMLADREQP